MHSLWASVGLLALILKMPGPACPLLSTDSLYPQDYRKSCFLLRGLEQHSTIHGYLWLLSLESMVSVTELNFIQLVLSYFNPDFKNQSDVIF